MNLQRRFFLASVSLGLGLAIGLGISFVRAAWFEPTSIPPDGNIAAPLNISGVSQAKGGQLLLGWADPLVALITRRSPNALGMDAIFGGPVGIGTNVSSTYLNRIMNPLNPLTRPGGLDIAWAGSPATLLLGADDGRNTRTTGFEKDFSVASPNAGNTGQVTVLAGRNTPPISPAAPGKNQLNIGGGVTGQLLATEINFYTATDDFVTNGSLGGDVRMTIRPNGSVGIGTNSPRSLLDVAGRLTVNELQIPGGQIGNALMSDSQGIASWQPIQSGFSNFVIFGYTNTTSSGGGTCGSPMCASTGSGAWTWTVPVGVTKIMVEAWGGGGGGGNMSCSTISCTGATGGNAGGYGRGIYNVNPGGSYPVTVGIAGQNYRCAPFGSPKPGGLSRFSTLIQATGGGAGESVTVGSSDGQFALNGGLGVSIVGDYRGGYPGRTPFGKGGDAPLGGLGGVLYDSVTHAQDGRESKGGIPGGGGSATFGVASCGDIGRGGEGRVVVWW